MPKAFVNGINIHYAQAGGGPDLVLVHGLGANLAFWYFKVLPFLTGDFRATAYDMRGHGDSDMPASGYTSADMALDLYQLLDKLGIERAHVVAHSFGGVVALHFTVLFPERVASLTIADSRIGVLQPAQKLKDWPLWKLWKGRVEGLGAALDEEQVMNYSLLESLARHLPQGARRRRGAASTFVPFETWNGGKRGAARWLRLLNTTSARQDFESPAGLTVERIGQVQQATRAIYGEYSPCLPSAHRLQEQLPNCQTVVIPRVGHFYPMVRPRVFVRKLREFLLPLIR